MVTCIIYTDVKLCAAFWLLNLVSVPHSCGGLLICESTPILIKKKNFIILHSKLVWNYFIIINNKKVFFRHYKVITHMSSEAKLFAKDQANQNPGTGILEIGLMRSHPRSRDIGM